MEAVSMRTTMADIDLASNIHIVSPGEVIDTETGFLRGHGTQVIDGELVATVSGVVEKVNKLVSVRSLKARFTGDVGDVVVGRVTEVAQKRWKLDVGSRQDAVLMLSSINLPGGVQRRRTATDELNMRNFFEEGDLVSAEIQAFFQDGAMSLQTRSLKYGKLVNGQIVGVSANLVKRLSQHFVTLPCDIRMILGNNGWIWLEPIWENEKELVDGQELTLEEIKARTAPREVPAETREVIARVRNCILALNQAFVAIYPTTIMDTYQASLQARARIPDILLPANIVAFTRVARERQGAD